MVQDKAVSEIQPQIQQQGCVCAWVTFFDVNESPEGDFEEREMKLCRSHKRFNKRKLLELE